MARTVTSMARRVPISDVATIEMTDLNYRSLSSGAWTPTASITPLNTYEYGEGTQYFFEVVADNADSSDRNILLIDSAGNTKDTLTIPAGGAGRRRNSVAFTPNAGYDTYKITIPQTTSNSQVELWTARIIPIQAETTRTVIEFPFLQANQDSFSTSDTSGVLTTTSTSYVDVTNGSIWQWVSANWASLYSDDYTTSFTFYGILGNNNAGSTTSATLQNITDGTQVTSSEITNTGTQATLVQAHFNSDANFLTSKEFSTYFKTSANTGRIYKARLKIRLICNANTVMKGESYFRVGKSPLNSTSAANLTHGRSLYTSTQFTRPVVYFESTARESVAGSGGTTTLTLRDFTAGANVTGASNDYTGNATKTRIRSSALTVTSGNQFEVRRAPATGATIIPTQGLMVIAWSSS